MSSNGGTGDDAAPDPDSNDLLKVDHKGRISVVAVFPTQPAATPPGFPVPEIDTQAVPTSVVKGPDGAYYVGQLTGFPFPPGKASVFRVVPGHDPEVYAGGFVLGHGAAYITNNSILSDGGQVVKVDL